MRLAIIFASLVLVGAACGDSSDPGTTTSTTATQSTSSGGDETTTTSQPDAEDDQGQGSAADFDTVFPLPAGDVSELFPYQLIDDEFRRSEMATFLVGATDIETIISFYETTLPSMGYVVGDRLILGESIALNISDPANPAVTAVIQAGLANPSDPSVVQLNMERTELKEAADADGGDTDGGDTDGGDAGSASGSSDADDGDAETPDSQALDTSGSLVSVNWNSLASTPFFSPAGAGDDPLFLIHTNPATDGFFLSVEMYTTGYGQQWTGQTGTFDISCADPANSTGICPYFDPDGPGPMPVLGDDFATTGSLTIVRLDDTGYEIVFHELVFSDGTSFAEFTITG